MNKKIVRTSIISLLILILAVTTYFCYQAYQKAEWGTITGGLAVVAALLTVVSSISLTWRLEDEKEPYLNIFFDSKSHVRGTSLVVRNDGGSPAFNIRLEWSEVLLDTYGQQVQFNEHPHGFDILILNPGAKVSRFVNGTIAMFEDYDDTPVPIYKGTLYYSTSRFKKSKLKQDFQISIEHIRKSLLSEDDQAAFYFNNSKLGEKVSEMNKTMISINENLKKIIEAAAIGDHPKTS